MATTESNGMNGPRSYPGYYDNARDYVLDHLDPHEPRSPAELADEYDCSGDHMRGTLAELAESGEVERVSRGQYVLPDGEASTDAEDHMGTGDGDTTLPDPDTASTADLYQRQHAQSGGGGEREIAEDDAGAEDVEKETSVEGADAVPAASLPVDPKTLGTILAVAVGLWVAHRALAGDGDPEPNTEADDEPDAEPSGGLTG